MLERKPPISKCTTAGDIYALATAFWQIFNKGFRPLRKVKEKVIRSKYLSGYRLAKPKSIKGNKQKY